MREEGGRLAPGAAAAVACTLLAPRPAGRALIGLGAAIGIVLLATAGSCQAAFPGRNGDLVYSVRAGSPPSTELYLISPDGSHKANITNSADAEYDPAFSPDGKSIVFSQPCSAPGGCAGAIYLMNADGSGRVTIRDDGLDPSFSPDGMRIVFFRRTKTYDPYDMSTWFPFDIFVMNLDGSGLTQLTTINQQLEDPSFSPDGDRILFQTGYDIYVMNADGSGITNLTQTAEREMNPSFSPDGEKIVFERLLNSDPFARNTDLFVMNADGSGSVNITNTTDMSEASPVFSPDGRKIAFVGITGLAYIGDVYTMSLGGSDRVNLTHSPDDDRDPDWQPVAVSCGGGTATIVGTDGRDRLKGGPDDDVIAGLGGNDRISGSGGDDVICGGPGRDSIVGGGGKDKCVGGGGGDSARRCEKERST